MTRKIIAYISDSHAGHMHGLVNPATTLIGMRQDGDLYEYKPTLNEIQKYLWGIYTDGIVSTASLADGDEIILIHGGDPTHGIKYTDAVSEPTIENQLAIAVANLEPWLQVGVKRMRIVAGTGSHEYNDGSATGLIRRMFKEHSDVDIKALYHGLLDVDGFTVDYAHHGPGPGIRMWTKGNVARYYLISLMTAEIVDGSRPPDLVLRGHYHEYTDERVRLGEHVSWIVIAPSMCMPDSYTRQVTKSVYRVRNGVTAFELVDGKLADIHCYHKTVDIRTREVL